LYVPDVVAATVAALDSPGLVVLTGGPGAGRSSALRRVGEAYHGPVFAGGGLAMLTGVPALPLARAVRARLPGDDPALLAEAVRSRVRGGLLLLDDLQWADPATVAALPAIARHCRVAVALRTPHRIPADLLAALRAAAAGWFTVPPLDGAGAAGLARRVAPRLDQATIAEVVRRAGGVPLAVETLARHAAAHGLSTVEETGTGGTAYAVAEALADLTRPARTALAALGLLGRPAPAALLGTGVDELTTAGLVTVDPADSGPARAQRAPAGGPEPASSGLTSQARRAPAGTVAPVSPYVAEVAAGLLDEAARADLHRHLAALVPPREAVAAAGDAGPAYELAVAAGRAAATAGERADALLFACTLPVAAGPVRLEAAAAALAVGRPRAALRALGDDPAGGELRAEALLQVGEVAQAARVIGDRPGPAADRVRLLALLATDPAAARARVATVSAQTPAVAGAVAAVHAAWRTPGWEYGLAQAAEAAGAGGDALTARWCAWLLVETLAADARLAEAAQTAEAAARACAADLAYSWQTRFLATHLWCLVLRGEAVDEVVRRAGDLTDRTLPADARGYAAAAASLAEADAGLLAPARARLAAVPATPPAIAGLLDWVARETAWLDGQPEQAAAPAGPPTRLRLVDGLRRITARWAAFDCGATPAAADPPASGTAFGTVDGEPLPPVRDTLDAWAARDPDRFDTAAAAWHDLAVREEIRCLLAHGLLATDPADAVPPLLAAEKLAEQAGLVVLLGRAHRGLRRHAVRRDVRGPRAGTELTDRERDVLRLVAAGEPTRRIAGRLGISGETVETHIRSGMRKLGARTRTEAAALALEVLG